MRNTFLDKVRIFVKGGVGGAGCPKIKGKGGDGGSVYVEARKGATLRSLAFDNSSKRFLAEPGRQAARRAILGTPGTDLIIPVPPGVAVCVDTGQELGDLDRPGQRLLVCRGGRGGGPHNGYISESPQARSIRLDLKLIADVGFVGFPNAGKSTLMRTMSGTKTKVASYPFTTIQPQVATLLYPDRRQITLADLPGLIEGAHVNVGMGHHFLKHVERTKLLLFVVDCLGFKFNSFSPYRTPLQTVLLLIRELELYKPALLDKPAVCVINKIDVDDGEALAIHTRSQLADLDKSMREHLEPDLWPSRLLKFDDVLILSAKMGRNTEELKNAIRKCLDDAALRSKKAELEDAALIQRDKIESAFTETLPTVV